MHLDFSNAEGVVDLLVLDLIPVLAVLQVDQAGKEHFLLLLLLPPVIRVLLQK